MEMPLPLVKVIVPFYNAEKTLSRLVDSILAQTYQNIEIILLNNASDDLSEDIYEALYSSLSNIKMITRTENIGSFLNIYNAITYTQEGFYAVIADDMYIETNYIEACVNHLMKNSDTAIVYTGVHLHCPDKVIKHIDSYNLDSDNVYKRVSAIIGDLHYGTAIYGVYNAKNMCSIRRFWSDISSVRLSDLELLLSVVLKYKIKQIEEVLIHRIVDPPVTNTNYGERLKRSFGVKQDKPKLLFCSSIKSIYELLSEHFSDETSEVFINILIKRFQGQIFEELEQLPTLLAQCRQNRVKLDLLFDMSFVQSLIDPNASNRLIAQLESYYV